MALTVRKRDGSDGSPEVDGPGTPAISLPNTSPCSSLRWMWATLFASAIVLGLLMFLTSGDIPREDEWDTPGDYLVARTNGTANFASLFRQHNESRIVISQLLAALITAHWGWNQHVLHAINWAITLGLSLCSIDSENLAPKFSAALAAALNRVLSRGLGLYSSAMAQSAF